MEKDPVQDGPKQEARPEGKKYEAWRAEHDDPIFERKGVPVDQPSFDRWGMAAEAPPESVAGPAMHLYEVGVEPALTGEIIAATGPTQSYAIVAASPTDARDEAVRRWHDNVRLAVHIDVRSPILVERRGRLTVTHDGPDLPPWWRRIFR